MDNFYILSLIFRFNNPQICIPALKVLKTGFCINSTVTLESKTLGLALQKNTDIINSPGPFYSRSHIEFCAMVHKLLCTGSGQSTRKNKI